MKYRIATALEDDTTDSTVGQGFRHKQSEPDPYQLYSCLPQCLSGEKVLHRTFVSLFQVQYINRILSCQYRFRRADMQSSTDGTVPEPDQPNGRPGQEIQRSKPGTEAKTIAAPRVNMTAEKIKTDPETEIEGTDAIANTLATLANQTGNP